MRSASSIYNPMMAQSVSNNPNPDFMKAIKVVKEQYQMSRRMGSVCDSSFMRGSEATHRGSEMRGSEVHRASEVDA